MIVSIDTETAGLNTDYNLLEASFTWKHGVNKYRCVRFVNCGHSFIVGQIPAVLMNMELLREIHQAQTTYNFEHHAYHQTGWNHDHSFKDNLLGEIQVSQKSIYITDWKLISGLLEENGLSPIEKHTALGKNLEFDFGFLRLETESEDHSLGDHRFHFRRVDLGSLYLKPSDLVPPSFIECVKRSFGELFESLNVEKQHTSIWDTVMAYRLYERWCHAQGSDTTN